MLANMQGYSSPAVLFPFRLPLRFASPLPPQGHEEMTIEEIMLGKGDYYPGLVPLVYAYLGHIGCDADTMDTIDQVRLTVVASYLDGVYDRVPTAKLLS